MAGDAWPHAVVTARREGNHAIPARESHYIRCRNGDKELYDHPVDPDEHTNLAGRKESAAGLAGLARSVPTPNQPAQQLDNRGAGSGSAR